MRFFFSRRTTRAEERGDSEIMEQKTAKDELDGGKKSWEAPAHSEFKGYGIDA